MLAKVSHALIVHKSFTLTHVHTQVRQEAKANADHARRNANLVKDSVRNSKNLERQVRREQYLVIKSTRSAEVAAKSAQDTINRLEDTVAKQQSQITELEKLLKLVSNDLHKEK